MVSPLTAGDPETLGDYALDARLGEGGQGIVYLARTRSGDQVAVKLLSAGDAHTRARLARELEAMESIASFCTARVLDVSLDGGRPYVVSEFVDGPSLADRVSMRGPLRDGELERLIVGTATALAAIHAAGIVHRDFKPANVLLGPDGPRVVDFGIARAEGAATMTSGLIGTPAYLSPEQIHGTPAAPASDVFAWGATMVFAANGASPFGAETVPAAMQRVLTLEPDLSALPARLRGPIAAALSKDPAHRPTARDLMVALVDPSPAAVNTAGPYGGPPHRTGPQHSALTTQSAPRNRGRGALLGGIAAVVALAVTGGALVLFNQRPDDVRRQTATTTPPSVAQTREVTQPSTQAQTGLKIPEAFAGTWAGHTKSENPADTNGADNTIVLKAGQAAAAWTETDQAVRCTSRIRLSGVEDRRLTFALENIKGDCMTGTIWLDLDGDVLKYTWRDVPGFGLDTQTGDLRKR
ncbi:serine/threonine-protein kinase [Nonomuraea typhae]|uniref:serine/threonine-protein kinase n=1 Tax=Nonomuraea typhae TaxID=2603600 RepID=UPI0012FBFFC8|nr:serine/threonine-protein kinase [Nonomuraea typhae]